MKIAYLSHTCFSDVDFSFLSELYKKADVYYFISINPQTLRGAAINIHKQFNKAGIYNANIYPEISKYSDIINIEKTFVINRVYNKSYSIKNIKVTYDLVFKLLKLKIDILHITDFFQLFEFPLYLFKKRIILTMHDPFPHSSVKSKKIFLYRNLGFKLLNNFIILNKSQRQKFIRSNKLENKNIINSQLSVYTYLNRYKNTISLSEKKYILFFGQISSYKGLNYLFPAMKLVHQIYPDIHIIIAGSKKFHFDIEEYKNLDYFDIRNRFIQDNELAALIQSALFVVCPYTDSTQSGVIMSAYTFNKPVLATNVGGIPETVEHLKSGYLIPPKDVEKLANAIIYLLSNENLLKEMEEYIENLYTDGEKSWKKIVENLYPAYENIIRKNKNVD